MTDKGEIIERIEQEEDLNRQLNEVRTMVVEQIIQPIHRLAQVAPFTVAYVSKMSSSDRILQVSSYDTYFEEGDRVLVIKLDNFDLTTPKLAPFFKAQISKGNKVYVPKAFHDNYPIRTKVLIVKPILH
jgi:hypothetical protein